MNTNSEYIYDENKKVFYERKKFLFKNILKQIPNEIIFDSLKVKNFIPIINGMSLSSYLLRKANYNLSYKKSDYDKKVHFVINKFNIDNENKFIFLSGKMLDDNNFKYFEVEIKEPLNQSLTSKKEIFEDLFSVAFSGNRTTIRERHKMFSALLKNTAIGYNMYTCDVCKETFTNIDEYFSHILEEKHFCSFLDLFPYDNEVINVKKILTRDI